MPPLNRSVVALLFFSAVVGGTVLVTPKYRAQASVWVRPRPRQQILLFSDLAAEARESPRTVPSANLVYLITNRNAAAAIVKEFKLAEKTRRQYEEPSNLRERVRWLVRSAVRGAVTLLSYVHVIEPPREPQLGPER